MKKGLLFLISSFPFLFGAVWADAGAVDTWIAGVGPSTDLDMDFTVGPDGKIWLINHKTILQWDINSPGKDQTVPFWDSKQRVEFDKRTGRLTTYIKRKLVVLDPDQLDTLAGIASKIAIDTKGRPWVVTTTNDLYRFEGKFWKRLPGKLSDIAIGINGGVWGLAAKSSINKQGYSVLKLSGTSWEETDVASTPGRLVVDGSGEAWVISSQDAVAGGYNVYRSQNGRWTKMPELPQPLIKIASDHEGNVWVSASDRKYKKYRTLYKWRQSDWESVFHVGAGQMAFTRNGNLIFPYFHIPDGGVPLRKAKGLAFTPNLSVTSFTIDTNDVVWAVRNSKPLLAAGQAPEILKWDGQQFSAGISTRQLWQSDGNLGFTDMLMDIAFDQSGSPWILGSDYHLYRRADNAWVVADDRRLLSIVSSPKGVIWAIDEAPQIRSKRHTSPGFGFGTQVLRWEDGKLEEVGKAHWFIYNVAVDKNETPWITSRDTSIKNKRKQVGVYRLENGSWVKVPVPDEFSVTGKFGGGVDGSLWLGAMQGRLPVLLKWTGSRWEKHSDWFSPDQITGDSTGTPWALLNGGFVTTDSKMTPAKRAAVAKPVPKKTSASKIPASPAPKPKPVVAEVKSVAAAKRVPTKKAGAGEKPKNQVSSRKLVGCWKWFNGAYIIVENGGTVRNGIFPGTWVSDAAASGRFTITWPSIIDTIKVAGDGMSFAGANSFAVPISGTRLSGSPGRLSGKWLWMNGIQVDIGNDKSVKAGGLKAVWNKQGDRYTIEWPIVDVIGVSADGARLQGKNQFGALTAARDTTCAGP